MTPLLPSVLSEDNLVRKIERVFRKMGSRGRPVELEDDAALWRPTSGHETVLTCDQFLEGSHFLRDKHPPHAIGWKCLARAVSDIAAVGGAPRCFLLSLALPVSHAGAWFNEFLAGLRQASRRLRCEMAGGDSTERKEILVSITVVGEIPRNRAVLRSGAQVGDVIFASGILGEADLGLQQLRKMRGFAKPKSRALRKHLYPEPRLALGQWLARRRLATAMMDLSDGLSSDLPRLCRASGVGATIDLRGLPRVAGIDPAESISLALNGGDDYELLFTVPAKNLARVPRQFKGVALTPVGQITKGQKLTMIDHRGTAQRLLPGGWDPFRP